MQKINKVGVVRGDVSYRFNLRWWNLDIHLRWPRIRVRPRRPRMEPYHLPRDYELIKVTMMLHDQTQGTQNAIQVLISSSTTTEYQTELQRLMKLIGYERPDWAVGGCECSCMVCEDCEEAEDYLPDYYWEEASRPRHVCRSPIQKAGAWISSGTVLPEIERTSA